MLDLLFTFSFPFSIYYPVFQYSIWPPNCLPCKLPLVCCLSQCAVARSTCCRKASRASGNIWALIRSGTRSVINQANRLVINQAKEIIQPHFPLAPLSRSLMTSLRHLTVMGRQTVPPPKPNDSIR